MRRNHNPWPFCEGIILHEHLCEGIILHEHFCEGIIIHGRFAKESYPMDILRRNHNPWTFWKGIVSHQHFAKGSYSMHILQRDHTPCTLCEAVSRLQRHPAHGACTTTSPLRGNALPAALRAVETLGFVQRTEKNICPFLRRRISSARGRQTQNQILAPLYKL